MGGEVFYERGRKYNCRINGGKPSFRLTATIGGKRRTFYGDGEKEARKKVEEAKDLNSKGLDIEKKTETTKTVFRYWLFDIKRVDSKIKASTFARYEELYRLHILPYPIAESKLSAMTSVSFQAYITSLYEDHGYSTSKIKALVKLWKMFLSWANDEGYLIKNPARNLSVPGEYSKSAKEVVTFTDEERSILSSYMDEKHFEYDTLVKLAFATGMRKGELLALKWEDVHEDRIDVKQSTAVVAHVDKDGNRTRSREVWETKSLHSVRSIPILPKTYSMLRDHKKAQAEWFLRNGLPRTDYVFTTATGKMIDPSNFNRQFARLLRAAGIPHKKFHAIRHTFATEAIRRGVNVKDLQMLMGHSDIQTTYIYVHASDDSKRAAINLMGDIL